MGIEIYVANLGKYNEGELVGDWFTLPCSVEDIRVKIGSPEEMAIHDYEAPFRIREYDNIEELNEIAERMELLEDDYIKIVCKLMEYGIVSSFEEGIDYIEDGKVRMYYDCKSMADVAHEIVEENRYLDKLPKYLQFYFDYEAMGRDLEINSTFLYVGNSIFVEVIG